MACDTPIMNTTPIARWSLPLFLVPAGLLGLAGCASSHHDDAAEEAAEAAQASVEVNAAKTAFLASWTKSAGQTFTTDALGKHVANSADFLSFDGMSQDKTVIQGWNDYAAIWGPGMNGFTKASLSEVKSLRTWANDDMGVTASIVRIYGEMPNGQTLDAQGHLTLVFAPSKDGWRVVHEHMSMPVKE
jgi:ketosteroid isomerase-like protein